jgi:hypothetical protein
MAIARLANQFDSEILGIGTLPQPEPKVRITELISLLTPIVSLVLARGQTDRVRFWGIVGAGILIALIGTYRPVSAVLRRFARRRHDSAVARNYGQEFRRFTREAGNFLDSNISRADSLSAILNQISQRLSSQPQNSLLLALSRIPNTEIFRDRWYSFNARIQADKLAAKQFHAAVDELIAILRSHNSYCATPIFHTFANEYREILMNNEKSLLNAFQQSYRAYLERFAGFIDRLNDDFRELPELSAMIALPKPL